MRSGARPARKPERPLASRRDLRDSLSTVGQTDGPHSISLEFVDGGGIPVTPSNVILPLIDNRPCVAVVDELTLDGATADPVRGYLPHAALNMDPVTIDFTASQPHNDAGYSFGLIKGRTASPARAVRWHCRRPHSPFRSKRRWAAALPGGDRDQRGDQPSRYDRSAQVPFALAPAGS